MVSARGIRVSTCEYAELHCLSNFTFLRGASHAQELVTRAAGLGYQALAITDECSVAGVVRAHVAARDTSLKLIIGSEFQLNDGLRLVVLVCDRDGYAQLCQLISRGRRAAAKGSYSLERSDLSLLGAGCLILWLPARQIDTRQGVWLKKRFHGRLWIAVELLADGNGSQRLDTLQELGRQLDIPLVAAGDVHMHVRGRRALQDTLTAIRHVTTVQAAGWRLYANGERHLRSWSSLQVLYPRELLLQTLNVAQQCSFSLEELRYEYPAELVPEGYTPASWLRKLTKEGARRRWPGGLCASVQEQIEHELGLIEELQYEPYFLTVHDIVSFARSRGILCQGRGSAANSAVCFCLGITEVDPARMAMLFERFISRERNEPPDIDVDFEHERREEVIQYLYRKYSRERAALTATVISYRGKSAVRDVGKALGLDALQVERLARSMRWIREGAIDEQRIREAGFDPDSPLLRRLIALVGQIIGFPRHLSQHVGGFVISRGPLCELVPIENAAMPERTVIQWDKNDLDDLGLLKVDVLGLGMLSAIRRCFDLIKDFRGRALSLASVPAEDALVYDMICRADTVGVFQIESRAQMTMLPRLRPRCYYDLVIEVAIIRPGPIQGGMVHPYLRRRCGEEQVSYPSPEVESVLERTLGVPIFQEQVMQLAMVAAGFTAGQADSLRRAMAAWKRRGGLGPFEQVLIQGMRDRGYDEGFAQQIFKQIQGFGEYGFPESHAASFALLVYVSAWLKAHEPAAFACALINSQPMGFYAPSQLIQDARRHAVEVRPVDAQVSHWDCTLETCAGSQPALRLGLRLVKGFSNEAALRLLDARQDRAFSDTQEMAERARLDRGELGALAAADALQTLSGNRHFSYWQVTGVEKPTLMFPHWRVAEGEPLLNRPGEGEEIAADYNHLGLTLRRHPLALLRERLDRAHMLTAEQLWDLPDGKWMHTAGLVITRQRPGTASGVTFVTLEDETGNVNLVIWKDLAERQRKILLGSRLMAVRGRVQREGDVLHVIAHSLEDYTALLGSLSTCSRDFH
ncbi:MAG: error-prone DNA polymerase [Gammaproteobacteria bacterium]|nr:error-prone DNA polymerase [Gammaproteobacteria bacterium]